MPGISIISNFDIQQNVPMDSRMVATSSATREAIQYKYEGLKVYQTDTDNTYLWTGSTWSIELGGIYGGSGSLIGTTDINFGSMSNTSGFETPKLRYYSTTNQGKNIYFSGLFERNKYYGALLDYQQVEFRLQYSNIGNAGENLGPYIAFNPTSSNDGGIAFGAGEVATEKMRLAADGKLGIGTDNPQGNLQVGASTQNPLVWHLTGTNSTVGSNWYSGTVFDTTKGSVRTSYLDNGQFVVSNRTPNAPVGSFTQSLVATPGVVNILMNTAPSNWATVPPNLQLVSVPDYVNNYEHRYTKMQIDNWGTASFNIISSPQGVIVVNDSANSFDISVTPNLGYFATDIKINRGGTLYDLPDGTILNLRFTHTSTPASTGKFYLKLPTNDADTSTLFRSFYDDSILYGNTYSLSIEHLPSVTSNRWQGDTITFRRSGALGTFSGRWDIIGIERQKISNEYFSQIPISIPQAQWELSGLNSNLNIILWSFTYKPVGKSYLCNFYIRYGCSASNVLRSGYIQPKPTNPLYGKMPSLRTFVPGVAHRGPGIGTGAFLTAIDIDPTGTTAGWGFEIRRMDLVGGPTGSNDGYSPFPVAGATSGGQYWWGEFTINSLI